MDENYYTINEVAEKLKVTRKTVYSWMNSGSLKYVIAGGRRRVSSSDFEKFLHRENLQNHQPKIRTPTLVAA